MKKIISISLLAFLIDRISKIIITSLLKKGESIIIIKNFFSLTLAKNTGVAFSLLEGKTIFIILITILILFLLFEIIKKEQKKKEEVICYSIIIGSALGNLFDRLIYGYVIDFLDFKIFNYNYPIFNLADSCIVIAVFILIVIDFKEKEKHHENSSRKKLKN